MNQRTRGLVSTAAAVLLIVLGAVLVTGVVVVRRVVLAPSTYTSALVTADAYERIYTEVLADPELADAKEALLGDIGVSPNLAVQARALATNVLRWAAPPSTIQAGAEAVIEAALAYVRGDTPTVQADVAVDEVVARLHDSTLREVRTLLASAADRTVTSIDAFEAALGDLADQLAAGTVPDTIPKLGGTTFDPLEVVNAIFEGLGDRADPTTRELVTAAVLAQDQRDAVITAAATVVAAHADDAAERLRADGSIDLVAAAADRAERPVADVVATLDTARNAARWFRPATGVLGALLIAGGVGWLMRPRSGDRGLAALLVATTFTVTGLAVAALWGIVRVAVTPPLSAATTEGDDSWHLPAGARAVLGDVSGVVDDRLSTVVWRCCLTLVLVGAAVALGVAVRDGVARRVVRPHVGTAAGLALTGALAAVAIGVVAVSAPDPVRACNGHVELCDRAYDDVVYAATHNSMSAPDVVPIWPEHDGGLTEQLDAGVRALLIDTHTWPPLESAGQLADLVQPGEPRLSPALAASLYDTFSLVRDGRPGTFLCHIHCAFGAQTLVDGLDEVRLFLERNPDEVVTLIIQDDITPAETTEAFEEAGLLPFVRTHDPGSSWPTLGTLIDRNERLVVFAENAGPPPAWYANAFEAMQETPFLFLSPDEFSCSPNRGVADATLFQMNHWVQRIAPDRVDSARVNQLDVLVDRARQCAQERGQLPNYLAVNFYNIGDVVEAANVLNDV